MLEAKTEIIVSKPREAAFAFVADLQNNPKWITGVEWTRKISDGPIAKGTKLRNRFSERGGIEVDETIIEFEPGRSFAFEIHVPGMPVRGSFVFDTVTSGTKISFVEQIEPQRFLYKVLAPIMGIMIKRQIKADFARLRDLLTSEA